MSHFSNLRRTSFAILGLAFGLSAACGDGPSEPVDDGSLDDGSFGGAKPIGHPLLDEPQGEDASNLANILVEGASVPRASATYSGEYQPTRADSEYVRCSYGNDPENLGHTRLLVVVGTVGSEPIVTLTLRDFDEPEQKTVRYGAASGLEELSLELRTPTSSAPDLTYSFGASTPQSTQCLVDLVELSAARVVGTVACGDLVDSARQTEATLSGSVDFECALAEALPNSGSGGQSGSGGASPGGGGGSSGGAGVVGDGPGEAVSVTEYCEARAKPEAAWCAYIDKCCSEADKGDINFVFPECTFGPVSGADGCVENIQTQMARGSVWDGTWAMACAFELDKDAPVPSSICSGINYKEWSEGPNQTAAYGRTKACREMLTGNRGEGAECDYASDCAPGIKCGEVGDNKFACGKFGTSGVHCISSGDCVDGLVCRQKVLDGVCGEPAPEYSDCFYSSECEDGLICQRGECRRTVPGGSSCANDEICEAGYGCNGSDVCVLVGQIGQTCITSLSCNGRCDSTTSQCVEICGGTLF